MNWQFVRALSAGPLTAARTVFIRNENGRFRTQPIWRFTDSFFTLFSIIAFLLVARSPPALCGDLKPDADEVLPDRRHHRRALAGGLVLGRRAQEPGKAPAPPSIREEAPACERIGLVRLEQKTMTLTFPGALNMNQGLLEYLIVTPLGSTHESLLVTEAPPTDIQFAMLLLGAKGSGINTPGADRRRRLRSTPNISRRRPASWATTS